MKTINKNKIIIATGGTGGHVFPAYSLAKNFIKNDYLVEIKSNISNKAEVHQMIVENDIMKMKSLVGGIKVKAKSIIYLKPGANHIMFMKLQNKIKLNSVHQVNLVFQKAGKLILNMPVHKTSFVVKNHKD